MIAPLPLRSFENEVRDFPAEARQRVAQVNLTFEQAQQLTDEHGSPLLVVSKSKLIDTYWAMKNSMPGVDLYYAAKANPDRHILSTLCAENAYVDVCSAGEMHAALVAGFTPDRMLHTHPCKTDSNLLECYEAGVRWFVYDNPIEAAKIARLTPDVNLLLRIATTGASSKINLSAKFGTPIEETLEMLAVAKSMNLNVRGFSFHVGSQCLNPEDYCGVLRNIRQVWEDARSAGYRLEVLDIGGGFPAPYRDDAPTIESFGGAIWTGLQETFGDLDIRLIAEPGRGLCTECVTLITKVIGKSTRWGMPWVYVDDGLYGSFSGKMFDHTDFPLFVQNDGSREVGPCVVAGPTCDSSDIVCRDQMLPEMELGDLILVPSMGAYAGASASPFNGLPVARSISFG
ncbi:type III PLP-dependent enzyme [Neorhodopirellula pilleata]|uniref:Lysine/ornithine decarboxylase n=1 Tax=Neorhodopirellula pilleata TaxID=2714738 RepID=A0A5C6AV25_9BACT|nr:type III PLP-dependent enzyme [Neorhodopirellula pilleata]TWU03291.1 Lysine/ornithine decarboxylase [Neorhodopirellula pilleata]